MKAIKSWTISDDFWEQAKPLISKPGRKTKLKYLRRPGGGRKPMDSRKVLEAIVYVLRTGCQWKALPRSEFGSASSVHKYFLESKNPRSKARRWVVERSLSWLDRFRKLLVRFDKKTSSHEALLELACASIVFRRVITIYG